MITVRYNEALQMWCVFDDAMPAGMCWSSHETEAEALIEAAELRGEWCAPIVQV